MANRKLPFGYCIQAGQIQISEHEAKTVRMIFDRYTAGISYERLTDALNGQDVPYISGKFWNKNMVARILQDERYMGGSGYPQIVTQESFRFARVAKPCVTGTVDCAEVTDIRILARCGLCHGSMRRERKNRWRCHCCMESPASIKDEHLILCADQLLRRLREHPDAAVPSPSLPADSEMILCMQDNFTHELDNPEFDESAATANALALAATRFGALDSRDYETMRIQYILTQTKTCDGLNTGLLRQIVSAVLVYPTGAVSLQLKNGQTINDRME